MLRIALLLLMSVIIFGAHPAQAQQPTWVAPNDITELSSDDYFLLFCSSCTDLGDASHNRMRNWTPSLGGLPDVDTTGLATDDLLRYNGTNFLPLNIDEINEGSGLASVELGGGANASDTVTVSVGTDSTASGSGCSSYGYESFCNSSSGTALGRRAEVRANNGSSFGESAVVSPGHASSTAIGRNATTTEANQIMMGTATETVHVPGDLEISDLGTDEIMVGNGSGSIVYESGGTLRTTLGLAIGTDVQAYDADLTTYAGITPSANVQSLLGAADYAAMRTQLDLEAGTDFYSISAADAAFQPLDSELTTLAGLTETNGNVVYASGGAWTSEPISNIVALARECVRLSDIGSDAAAGTGVANMFFSSAITVEGVYAWVDVAPVGSVAIIDINDNGTSIMTTNKLSIDAGEKTSGTATTAAALTDTAIAANTEITFDIDQVGSSTAGQGYVACIEYTYQ